MRAIDYKWFVEHYDELYKKYGKAFLAIKDKHVFGVYKSFAEGVQGASSREEPGTFLLQECNGSEDAYTIHITSMNFMD